MFYEHPPLQRDAEETIVAPDERFQRCISTSDNLLKSAGLKLSGRQVSESPTWGYVVRSSFPSEPSGNPNEVFVVVCWQMPGSQIVGTHIDLSSVVHSPVSNEDSG